MASSFRKASYTVYTVPTGYYGMIKQQLAAPILKFKLNLKYVKSVEIAQIHSLKAQQKCAELLLKVNS